MSQQGPLFIAVRFVWRLGSRAGVVITSQCHSFISVSPAT